MHFGDPITLLLVTSCAFRGSQRETVWPDKERKRKMEECHQLGGRAPFIYLRIDSYRVSPDKHVVFHELAICK